MADSGIGQPQDPKATDTTSSWSVIALLKYLIDKIGVAAGATTISGPLNRRSDATSVSVAVSTEDAALLNALLTITDFDSKIGALTETAPANDTASSGLNGRLQRIAQNITTFIAKFANDSTDKIRVSLYGKNSVAGDAALLTVTAANAADTGAATLAAGLVFYDTTNALMRRVVAPRADAVSQFEAVAVGELLFNGTNLDRRRNNTANIVLASAARTATVSTDLTNYNSSRITITLNITAAPNTASTITIQIRAKDSISGNYSTLLASVAIVGTASQSPPYTNRYIVALGITTAANVAAIDVLNRTMNVNVVHSDAASWTYSISAELSGA